MDDGRLVVVEEEEAEELERRQHDDRRRRQFKRQPPVDVAAASDGNKGPAQSAGGKKPVGLEGNSSRHSYSKRFRQYLAKPSNNLNESNSSRQKPEVDKQQQRRSSNLITSALSRLSLLVHHHQSDNSSNRLLATTTSIKAGEFKERAKSDYQRQVSAASSSATTSTSTFKRKGFLYLKGAGAGEEKAEEAEETGGRQGAVNFKSAASRNSTSSDNNNNSSSCVTLNHSEQHHRDEHKTCLLEEIECEFPVSGHTDDNNNNSQEISSQMKRKQDKIMSSSGRLMVAASSGLLLIALVALVAPQLMLVARAQRQPQPQPQDQRMPSATLQPAPPVSAAQGNGPRPQPAAGSLVANINCNKIRGHVTLTPNANGGSTVSTQILAGPPGEVYQWGVHQFPVKPGAAMCTCSPMILGSKLLDLSEMHGNLPSDQEFQVQSSLNLFGPDSPVGHSLLLRGMKTGMVACATFLPTSRKSNYRAKFHSPLSGSVTIFQTAFGTSFISHLMYSNGTRRHSVHRFDLVKSEDEGAPVASLAGGSVLAAAGRPGQEQLAWEQREHEHELDRCRRFASGGLGEPIFGRNVSHLLAVSTENFGMRGRTSLVLPQIPFESFSSVMLVVYSEWDPQEPLACAPLRFVKPKTAAAKFQSVSVQGSVVFSQDSPYDPTVARVQLQLPNSDGHSYGIDELPMIIRRKSDQRVCPNIREIIYNPHHVEPSSVPGEGEATSDQYAVGDLSGKYGSLTGKSSEKLQVQDFNLPLYGPLSVVGRAMTVYSAEGVAIACSNLELTTPMTTAFATFDFGIQGQFIFRQPVNDCNGDTYVYIEVSKPVASTSSSSSSSSASTSASTERSIDHLWHIHTEPVDSGLEHLSTTECQAAGPHFNPYNTSTAGIYQRDCTPFNVLRCELGDLASKMFTIEIPPYRVKSTGQEPDIGKFFGTDIDLPLCGPVSVVNRSVVVHVQDFGHQRLACSTVIEFKPRS